MVYVSLVWCMLHGVVSESIDKMDLFDCNEMECAFLFIFGTLRHEELVKKRVSTSEKMSEMPKQGQVSTNMKVSVLNVKAN